MSEICETLDNLPEGKDAVIAALNCPDKELRQHILDMGLTPGVEITLVKKAPLGNPIEFRIRGYELTLRKEDAHFIKIENIHDTRNCPKKNKVFKQIPHSKIAEDINYQKSGGICKTNVKLALIGNQNCGKTTLFNYICGANRHVGNFPGVTVDITEGIIKNRKNATVVDLPGIYSLSPYGSEEILTRNFILNEKPDGIINIVDAVNIERNLYLTMQLIELDTPMVIALNMMDEINQNSGAIDINGLEEVLGVPVVPVCASKGEGLEELIDHAINAASHDERPKKIDFCSSNSDNCAIIHKCIHSISHLIEDKAKRAGIPLKFATHKLVEDDELIKNALGLEDREKEILDDIIAETEAQRGLDRQAALADMMFSFIENLSGCFVKKPDETIGYKITKNIDKILTGKYSALVTFLAIMALIFYFTFGPLGGGLSELFEKLIEIFTNKIDSALFDYRLNPIAHSLIIDGIFSGVGCVLGFLPVIIVLFFFLSLLEDSGYMARVAFIMDRLLRKIGLSGRSFVPMLIGFGCSVPAIMASRVLPSERDRKMTIFLIPFMSCSAKLPIYALFCAAFFENHKVEMILGLYLIGIIVGIIFSYIIKFFIFKGEPVPFVMELPNYRMPSFRNVCNLIYDKAKDFVVRAFTIIFLATIIIWFLQTFDLKLNVADDPSNSILSYLGNLISPLFKPLGISDWRISTAFITGFMAKESVVSTLSILSGGDTDNLPLLFNKLTAFVFLVFCLLYTPCVAAIATVKRELGKKYALLVVITQCAIAWGTAFIVYNIFKQYF